MINEKKMISIIWIVLCLMLFTAFMWCLTFFDAVYNIYRYFTAHCKFYGVFDVVSYSLTMWI